MSRAVCFALVIWALELVACTGLRLTAKDGSTVNGRTVEFGVVIDMTAAVIPRNVSFVGTTPQGKGLAYTSKYAVVGIYCFDDPALMDGMNERGLVAASFFFPGFAQYAQITTANQSKALSPVEFPNWILTQFATVEEVKRALPSVVIAPTVVNGWGSEPAPFHYVVYDKRGRSIVIEPVNGTLVVHDNPLGTITNSPTFDWHIANLRNFINLTPFNVNPVQLGSVELAPFGQGSGMVGLPGDFTPPSRFVRAAIFSTTAIPSPDSEEAVYQAFHILNQFDIPVGVARQKTSGGIATDYTMMTSVKDPQTLKYYYKSYDDQIIKFIDLTKFDFNAKTIKKSVLKGKETSLDASFYLH